MKAVILAAGIGSRLKPLTNNLPKTLLKVNGRPILGRIIDSLTACGITNFHFIVGYKAKDIKNFISKKYSHIKAEYTFNPRYSQTNYIYSIWLASKYLRDKKIILLHGDLIFDPELALKVINNHISGVLVKDSLNVPNKDFKALLDDNGLVTKIGVNFFGPQARFCPPFFKLNQREINIWLTEIDKFVKQGQTNCYAEDAFNARDDLTLQPIFYNSSACMEVDDFDDLKKAQSIFMQKKYSLVKKNNYKILLANPPYRISLSNKQEKVFVRAGSRWPFSVILKKGESPSYLPFPFYLAYTSALLKQEQKFTVLVDDAIASGKNLKQFLKDTVLAGPDIILYETATPTIYFDIKLASSLKKLLPSVKIVLVGPHASTYAEKILAKYSQIDFIIKNEYELAFLQLVNKLASGLRYDKVDGLVFRDKGKIVSNEPRLIDPIDQLPLPDRDVFPLEKYWDGFCQHKPAVQMHATRGCPFACNFCLWTQVMYNRTQKYRSFSTDRVVEEMKTVVEKYGVKEIYFDDDTFTGNRKNVLDLCQKIISSNLPKRVNWSCMADLMVTNKEMIDKMAEAGCIGFKFGVETGDPQIAKKIRKPINHQKILELSSYLAKKRIKSHATFTFGLSSETNETMRRTLDFAKKLDVDSVQFSINTPFPGTSYYQEARNKNLILARSWQDFDGAASGVVSFENLTKEEVEKFYQKAYGRWLRYKLTRPQWIKRQMYNLNRSVKGQGIGYLFNRLKRTVQLFFNF